MRTPTGRYGNDLAAKLRVRSALTFLARQDLVVALSRHPSRKAHGRPIRTSGLSVMRPQRLRTQVLRGEPELKMA